MVTVGRRPLALAATGVCVAAISACGAGQANLIRRPASRGSQSQFQVSGYLAANGNPEPGVSSYPDGAMQTGRWSMCAPHAGTCTSLSTNLGQAEPGPQPAGTVFRMRVRWDGRTYSRRLRWRGALRVQRAPTLTGTLRVGATVRVAAAQWSGGWGTEFDALGIEACRTIRARHCVMLTGDWIDCSSSGCGIRGGLVGTTNAATHAHVGSWFTGWYLFALDARLSNDVSGAVGWSSYAAIKPWPRNRVIARSRPYGPISGPPRPTLIIYSRTRADNGHVPVAAIDCPVPCDANVTVSLEHPVSGKQGMWTAREVITGTQTIGVSRTLPLGQPSGQLPSGQVAVKVQVGNGPYITRHSFVK